MVVMHPLDSLIVLVGQGALVVKMVCAQVAVAVVLRALGDLERSQAYLESVVAPLDAIIIMVVAGVADITVGVQVAPLVEEVAPVG